MNSEEMIGFKATHPGWLLKRGLKTREIKPEEFAHDIGIEPAMLKRILNEKRPITHDIALSLEKTLGIPADFWIGFQLHYEYQGVLYYLFSGKYRPFCQ